MPTITFETKIWEQDWRYILHGDYLKTVIDRCQLNFDKRTLIINNVKNKSLVKKQAQLKVEEGIIDNFYFAEDYAEQALQFFNITKESFKGGYYYSIAELVSIYLCDTDYLLHFSGDAYLQRYANSWIGKAIDSLASSNKYVVANACWDFKFEEAKKESSDDIDDFYISQGFSDQCYLIKTLVFRQKDIYNEKHIYSERYPKYGGELFEKRVDSFLRNKNLYRLTSKHVTYIHKNFSKSSILQKNAFLRSLYLKLRLQK